MLNQGFEEPQVFGGQQYEIDEQVIYFFFLFTGASVPLLPVLRVLRAVPHHME